jgi:hypothetical protein
MKLVVLTAAALLTASSYTEAQAGSGLAWLAPFKQHNTVYFGEKPTTTSIWVTPNAPNDASGGKNVQVLGRTWTVSPLKDKQAGYSAVRDNNDNKRFGRPVARRTPQALRAIELATGCRVVRSSMVQDTSARFFATVQCK